MSSTLTQTLKAALAVLLFLRLSAVAGPVHVSFLSERAVLRDTVNLLTSSGCTREAVGGFERAVERYQATSLEFDYTKFPQVRDGFYEFESAARLVAALPHPLCDTRHAYDFNCFDTVITVAAGRLRTGLRPDEIFGPFLVPYTATNGAFMIRPAATARDAFALAYHGWYREATERAFPQSLSEARVSLTAALFRSHVLPTSSTEPKLGNGVLEALRSSWRRQDFAFPQGFEVVLCHEVHFPQRMFTTAHAGLLFRRKKGYTYLEKAGGNGPFVRLDFEGRDDLLPWLSGIFRGASKFGYTHHFATFNDTKIEALEFTK